MSTRRRIVEEAEEKLPKVTRMELHRKYRPTHWDDVIGQGAVVGSLERALKGDAPLHSFLFTGPSGTGKTTLARIVASKLKIDAGNTIEIDAATNNGVDVMRDLMTPLRYQGFGDNPNKAVIIDECHMLSKGAWNSLLKIVEEPPAHVFFFFCTTESGKVPDAILTRCASYNLRPLKYAEIMDLLEMVCDKEDLPTPRRVLEMIAQGCNGSPRLALVMLAQCHDARDEEEAARVLETPLENKEIIDLCRDLVSGKLDWSRLTGTLKALPEMQAESIRIMVANYLAACLMGAKTDKQAIRLLEMLECFDRPYASSDKLAPLLISFGRLIFR